MMLLLLAQPLQFKYKTHLNQFTISFFTLIAALCLFASSAAAAQVTLTWDANNESVLAGYKMYYGTSSGHYTASIDVGNKTTCTIPNLTGGTTYYFAVTAYTTDNSESGYSNQVSYTVPADPVSADPLPSEATSPSNCSLTVDILGSGSVLLDPPGGIYNLGTVVTLTAQADHAWIFDGWTGCVSDTDASATTVVMDTDISLSAAFLEDTDLDTIPDREEWGEGGLDNTFDGNDDGIADYLQDNVASIHTDDYLDFLTLSVPQPARITSCKTLNTASIADSPADCTFPLDLIVFKIDNIVPGGTTILTIHLPPGTEFNTYYKYGATLDNPTAHWYEFMYDQTSETGALFEGDTVKLFLKDGQRGDNDLSENGVISDPGGPGILQATNTTDPTSPDNHHHLKDGDTTTPSTINNGCFINSLFMN